MVSAEVPENKAARAIVLPLGMTARANSAIEFHSTIGLRARTRLQIFSGMPPHLLRSRPPPAVPLLDSFGAVPPVQKGRPPSRSASPPTGAGEEQHTQGNGRNRLYQTPPKKLSPREL